MFIRTIASKRIVCDRLYQLGYLYKNPQKRRRFTYTQLHFELNFKFDINTCIEFYNYVDSIEM